MNKTFTKQQKGGIMDTLGKNGQGLKDGKEGS